MIRKLLFLPLILLFISCTVTKRVHRTGFHIQWHKIERKQAPEEHQAVLQEAESVTPNDQTVSIQSSEPIKENAPLELEKEEEVASTIRSVTLSKSVKLKPPLSSSSETKKTNFESVFKSVLKKKTKAAKTSLKQSQRPIFWRMSSKDLKILGIVLMSLGGLLLLGSLLVTAGAFSGSGAGAGAWANFFIDLITISEWFWFLVFILVIVLLFYISFLLVSYVFGGVLISSIIGGSLLALGIFFFVLGKNREIEL